MSDARTFLEALWPLDVEPGEVLSISAQRPGRQVETATAETVDDLLPLVDKACQAGAHVWLNVASRRAGTTGRGGVADCVRLPALWADLDVAEGAPAEVHKGATFGTRADVHSFLARFPLPPTMLVSTGYGMSAWWVLDEPVPADVAQPLLEGLKATLTRLSAGRIDPSVYEVARMMRLPGTLNLKVSVDPRPVTIDLCTPAARYGLSELLDALDPPVTVGAVTAPLASGSGRPGDDYNAAMGTDDVVALLVAAGCTVVRPGAVTWLARPGKDARNGHSLSVGWVGPGVTYVYSSGWPELPAGTYTPFRLRAHLEHHGDYAACARRLAAEGYGGSNDAMLDELPELDGASVAEALVHHLDGDALYVHGAGWHLWDGTRFFIDGEAHGLMRRTITYARQMVRRARQDVHDAAGDEEALKLARAALKRAQAYLERGPRLSVIADAAANVGSDADSLDHEAELLNVLNGVVDLRTGRLSDHERRHRMTKVAAATFDAGARSADWTAALSALSPEMVDYLQVVVGLTIVGRSEGDLIVIAYGAGGNGKGTILGAIAHALGQYTHAAPAKLFTDQATRETQLMMPLRGARMAMAVETGEDHMLNMERLKALSGGDPITDRYLYSRSFATWNPTHTLWLQTNARPRVRNTDEGTWRRLHLVPFTSSYRRGVNRDEGLRERLRTDPVNRAAVLAWCVEGARRWLTTGVIPPCPEVELASQEWRSEEDVIASFLRDAGYEVTGDQSHWVGAGDLYRTYRNAASDNGQRPFAAPGFKREMDRYAAQLRDGRRPAFAYSRRAANNVWVGLRQLAADEVASYPQESGDVPW